MQRVYELLCGDTTSTHPVQRRRCCTFIILHSPPSVFTPQRYSLKTPKIFLKRINTFIFLFPYLLQLISFYVSFTYFFFLPPPSSRHHFHPSACTAHIFHPTFPCFFVLCIIYTFLLFTSLISLVWFHPPLFPFKG